MKINANFFTHHKTRRLQKMLGHDGIVSLMKLWGYAEQFRKDGVLSNMKKQDIELVAEWDGNAGLFVSSLVDIGFFDERDGVFSLHDWVDWSETEQTPPCPCGASPLYEGGSSIQKSLPLRGRCPEGTEGVPAFPPHEECDYQVDPEQCDESDYYADIIRKGIEVIPVDLFGTGKSADELRKESMGAHYDDYNAMMARTRGGTG